MSKFKTPALTRATAGKQDSKRIIYLVLDNARSVHNVGSIFRTAETLGVSRIFCVGATPTPLDRFNRKRKDFAKVALGAEDLVPWKHADNAVTLVEKLKKERFKIIVLEQTGKSVDYKKVKVNRKTAVIVGNEVDGVSPTLLELADIVAEIPMKGKKESLNISVAAGIFLYRLFDNF
jgi:tRNA G18 (ribose-2'-O)-methylase SpoU